jgi:hypothetical protein
MRPDLVLEFPARYDLVFHDRIPRALGLPSWELPAGKESDPQQELAAAPIVEVRPAESAPWVGIFFAEAAANIRGKLIAWPDEVSLCFFGGGGAYLVSSADPTRLTLIEGGPVLQQAYVVVETAIVLFSDWTSISAYDRSGVIWRSPRLALDDLHITGVDGDEIACTGFFGGKSDEPFTVDLRTGTTKDAPMSFDH